MKFLSPECKLGIAEKQYRGCKLGIAGKQYRGCKPGFAAKRCYKRNLFFFNYAEILPLWIHPIVVSYIGVPISRH
ncbi:jg20287 [Pararge aegeria aegeria]|uniref:Jg20287 protein n=1 Tax=Pararge aegeria aegeria TaxID=348720 RepID=A0A8S4S7J2_9NEOP|nr:jg20287 [Pararge aegeria aegeria]